MTSETAQLESGEWWLEGTDGDALANLARAIIETAFEDLGRAARFVPRLRARRGLARLDNLVGLSRQAAAQIRQDLEWFRSPDYELLAEFVGVSAEKFAEGFENGVPGRYPPAPEILQLLEEELRKIDPRPYLAASPRSEAL